jgi:hypothetical protein
MFILISSFLLSHYQWNPAPRELRGCISRTAAVLLKPLSFDLCTGIIPPGPLAGLANTFKLTFNLENEDPPIPSPCYRCFIALTTVSPEYCSIDSVAAGVVDHPKQLLAINWDGSDRDRIRLGDALNDSLANIP